MPLGGPPTRDATAPRPEPPDDLALDWIWIGEQRMFVVGHTSGGAPYGYVDGWDDLSTSVPADDDPAFADRESRG